MLKTLDQNIIKYAKQFSLPFSRFALFVVYFWFGILKIVGTSPANPLVGDLLHKTIPFLTFEQFIFWFSIYEMIIGIMFLIPKLNRLAIILLIPHMIMTVGPLVLLPQITWQSMFTPTLEGQYIIKNLLIIAAAITIWAGFKPKIKT